MKIEIRDTNEYDTGIHPDITEIRFMRRVEGTFFEGNRFPNLVKLNYDSNCLRPERELELCRPSLQILWCDNNEVTKLVLDCPSLLVLWCHINRLTELELNCPSLKTLRCQHNQLTKLELNCPSLKTLHCQTNRLTKLQLDCPSLQKLWCHNNQLADLNGIEFCTDLKELYCSPTLKESVEILKIHLPQLKAAYL